MNTRPKIRYVAITRASTRCPVCGAACKRHSAGLRRVSEIGVTGPAVIEVTYSKHYCERCRKHFSVGMDHIAPKCGRYSWRVRRKAVALVAQGRTVDAASDIMRRKHHVRVPATTLHDWKTGDAVGA